MMPDSVDNLLAAIFCIGGIVSCVRMFIQRPRDRFMATLVALVLLVNGVTQAAVVVGLNHAIGNGIYEVASEMLVIVAVLLVFTRRGQ